MNQVLLKENRMLLEQSKMTPQGKGILPFNFYDKNLGHLNAYVISSNEVAPNLFVVLAKPEAENLSDEKNYNMIKMSFPYQALITLDGALLCDFNEMCLEEYFHTKDKKQYCFTFKMTDSKDKQSYLTKNEEGEYSRIIPAQNEDQNYWFEPLMFLKEDEYWMCTHVNFFEMEEFQVYSPQKQRFVSNTFNEINFDMSDTPYFAQFHKIIYEKDPDDSKNLITFTDIIGYLDRNFLPASQIYDTTSEEFYSTESWETLSCFNQLIEQLKEKYYLQYLDKTIKTMDALSYMMNHPNPNKRKKTTLKKQKAKILKFPTLKEEE